MPRKKKQPEHENSERWMVSYADFITLMFAFFVVMFATSQTDKARAQQVSDSVKDAMSKGGVAAAVHEILGGTVDEKGKGNAQMKGPGGSQKSKEDPKPVPPAVAELLPSMQYLSRELEAEIHQGKIEIHFEPRGLVISLRQAAFFPSGGDAIDPKTHPAIEKIAQSIRALPNSVRLEGHTDSIPIHTARFRSNWELSAARGIAMMELLSGHFEIPRQRMAIAGYADTAPLDSNDTEEGRAHNRRVDIVILNQQAITTEPRASGSGAAPTGAAATEPRASGSGAAPTGAAATEPRASGPGAAPAGSAATEPRASGSGAAPAGSAAPPQPAGRKSGTE
jgi:chemotaxis protein MotB